MYHYILLCDLFSKMRLAKHAEKSNKIWQKKKSAKISKILLCMKFQSLQLSLCFRKAALKKVSFCSHTQKEYM